MCMLVSDAARLFGDESADIETSIAAEEVFIWNGDTNIPKPIHLLH